MKKLIVGALVLSFLFIAFGAKSASRDRELKAKRKRLEEAKQTLNNLEWKVKLNPIGETRKRAYQDTITFIDGKISSGKLDSEGFAPSNYTVSLKGENVIVWETMQTSERSGLAFWHGELEDEVMRGVLSRHPNERTHLDFSFYSIEKKTVRGGAFPTKKVTEEPKPKKPEPTEKTKKVPPKPKKKKKRGWLW